MIADPYDDGAVYVAEAAGTVRRVVLEVRSPSAEPSPTTKPRSTDK
jgi:hypothetical protein